ncbi:MAG: hypothetical protein ACAI43_22220 [Phycisphaerae bacterium]|nr:hypothetical protein [Tepidisphaeraceae bacterium]
MFDLWFELPTWLRVVMGLALIGVAALIFFASDGRRVAIGIGVIGLMMVLFAGAGNDKSGYNF